MFYKQVNLVLFAISMVYKNSMDLMHNNYYYLLPLMLYLITFETESILENLHINFISIESMD
jgi:hypothetical protein